MGLIYLHGDHESTFIAPSGYILYLYLLMNTPEQHQLYQRGDVLKTEQEPVLAQAFH